MQTKWASFLESCLNTASGFVLSLIVWHFLAKFMGYTITHSENLFITSVFTVVSVARSYVWRRIFNNRRSR